MRQRLLLLLCWAFVVGISLAELPKEETESETETERETEAETETERWVSCRSCGGDIAPVEALLVHSIPSSPLALRHTEYAFPEAPSQSFPVQVFRSPTNANHNLYTVAVEVCPEVVARTVSKNNKSTYNTWYEGYHYSTLLCDQCGAIVGWQFRKFLPVYGPDEFYILWLGAITAEEEMAAKNLPLPKV